MKNIVLMLFCIALLPSCEKNESADLLTRGTWILNKKMASPAKESIRFKTDNTYNIVAKVATPEIKDYKSGTISGDWSRQDDTLRFINSQLIPADANSLNIIAIPGVPMGVIYGITDLTNPGYIHYRDTNGSPLFYYEPLKESKWKIIKLTADSLIVDSKGERLKYSAE